MHVTTFSQLGIAKLYPKQEIIDVITKSKEKNEFVNKMLYNPTWNEYWFVERDGSLLQNWYTICNTF